MVVELLRMSEKVRYAKRAVDNVLGFRCCLRVRECK
jgi:hypothetical protein